MSRKRILSLSTPRPDKQKERGCSGELILSEFSVQIKTNVMTLFRMPRWLRRIIRRSTHPVPEVRAHFLKWRLSLLYVFFAWNLCGVVLYKVYIGKIKNEDSGVSQGRQFAELFKAENVTLVRMKGLNYIESVDLEDEKKQSEAEN
ncbi:hypothetical protein SK128_028564 [Halocaridina rubra]|uniref:Uncharacterized protein n=1 Tax=Halocaridina rubra TaxID=373956 RepID=A0AAN9AEJ2_HALRR